MPNPFEEQQDANNTEEIKPSRNGFKRMIGKTIALGSVIGLGALGNMDSALATEKGTGTEDSGDKNKIEQPVKKGSSLGVFYRNKFEHNDKEKALYKQALDRAKDILVDKGYELTDKNKISIELKANILSKITIDGVNVPIDKKYYTADEIKSIGLAEDASNAMSKPNETKENKGSTIKSKITVSKEADEFLK